MQFRPILPLLLLTVSLLQAQVSAPFNRGVNLTNWFQYSSIQQVQFSRYTYADFVDLQTLGVDVVRLPINLHAMTSGDPNYTVDPVLLGFLDEVMDWTETLDMHLILDNHTFDPSVATSPSIHQALSVIWPQMAQYFLDRGSQMYFEILNEPHGIDDLIWDTIQQNTVQDIRNIDSIRTLIVGPANWNSFHNLDDMQAYADTNLVYTFHFYDPFLFTHQGASWTDPSMVSLAGVPFPYTPAEMPTCPSDLVGTWIQSSLNDYHNVGNVASLQSALDIAYAFGVDRNVPLFCGEFGVLMDNADNDHRVEWYGAIAQYLDSLGIGWTMWDYHGGFGLFEEGSNGLFDHDLNIPLAEAMGFNSPPQSEFTLQPDTTGFYLYDDYISANILADHGTSGTLNMYYDTNPHEGDYCIYWSQAQQYDRVSFRFSPYKDLSSLLDDDYLLTLWVKSTGNATSLDLRFLDTKTDVPEDHPWRMGITLSQTDLNWDGEWQYLQLPLSDLVEKGSWDNAWYDPAGLFDWSAVDNFEIVAEHGDWTGSELWFDEIRIVDQVTASTKADWATPEAFTLEPNFPNPFNPSTTIRFALSEAAQISLTVFDVQGREIVTLMDGQVGQGLHETTWVADEMDSGLYFATLKSLNHSSTQKMLYLK